MLWLGYEEGMLCIRQIGESRITFHDDVFAVVSEHVSHARLNNRHLRLVVLRNPE